jgi:vitamin B12 transporter
MQLSPALPVALLAQVISFPVFADTSAPIRLEQIIVTATRAGDGLPLDLAGSSISVLDFQDLQSRQTRYIADVLRDVPGVAVNRAGGGGGLTQVRLRGTEGNHVLVLVDGMEVSDPFTGEFDFATMLADEVARVEVLRGQQSALYGSDAIGGVIHYMTGSGRQDPGIRTRIEGGSFNTWEGAARLAGSSGAIDYALSAGRRTTDGTPTSRFGTRKLGAENSVVSGRFEFAPTESFRFKAVTRYSSTDADTNDQDFNWPPGPTYGFVIDSDDYSKSRALYGLVGAELDSFEGAWTNALTLQGVDAQRRGYSEGALDSGSEGSRLKASYVSSLKFGSGDFRQSLTGAIDLKRERMQNTGPVYDPSMSLKREIENTGLVLQYNAIVDDRIGFGAAVRHDDNDRFTDATTYRVQGSYRLDGGMRLRVAAGSGIKNPTMTELFGYDPSSYLGNPNLKPEKSTGWEVGIDRRFGDDVAMLGVSYFDNRLEDEIYTVYAPITFVGSPENRTTESTQRGVELCGLIRLGGHWRIEASYTYLDAEEDGQEEVRRPKHIASLNVDWRILDDRAGLNLAVRYNGAMLDHDFTGLGGAFVRLQEFTLVNLAGDYRISDKLGLYARIENLFDEKYEEIYTFRSPGRGGYVGFRAAF